MIPDGGYTPFRWCLKSTVHNLGLVDYKYEEIGL